MKKLLLTILCLFMATTAYGAPVSVDAFLVSDDVTIEHLEDMRSTFQDAINNKDGQLLTNKTVSADSLTDNANPETHWGRAFNDWVYTGLLPATNASSLTTNVAAGSAFISDTSTIKQRLVQKDATAHTYTLNTWTFVDLSTNGTYTFTETAQGVAEPAIISNSIRLARVSTDASGVVAVRDDRTLSISLGTTEDFQRANMNITVVTPDAINISPGILYHGTTRIVKTANVSLDLGTASDWTTGVSARATSTDAFVVVDSSGNVKLTATAPTLADASSNTAGKLRYSSVSSILYRAIAWFRMNHNGSGDIDEDYSDFKDMTTHPTTHIVRSNTLSSTQTAYQPMNDMSAIFYSTGGVVRVKGNTRCSNSNNNNYVTTAIFIDGTIAPGSESSGEATTTSGNGDRETTASIWQGYLGQGSYTIDLRWKVDANTGYISDRFLIIEEL